jgi:hypothetical protein
MPVQCHYTVHLIFHFVKHSSLVPCMYIVRIAYETCSWLSAMQLHDTRTQPQQRTDQWDTQQLYADTTRPLSKKTSTASHAMTSQRPSIGRTIACRRSHADSDGGKGGIHSNGWPVMNPSDGIIEPKEAEWKEHDLSITALAVNHGVLLHLSKYSWPSLVTI